MKIKENFALQQIADVWVVMPLGEATADFTGMLSMNETGALLWRTLEKGGDREALAAALTAEYDVSKDQALADIDEFLNRLHEVGCLEW